MNCAVVPGGERENGNEATLIKSGEGFGVILWTKRRTSRRTPWLGFAGIWQASLGLPGDPV
jgi:hypothetical protein